ncbi:sulfurtransferase TusA family protein [Cohnella boryungensis]|uniref:Sulfurtransferase TusA family protein n=1 Tax=Cohnella boryungensis TaxID=768479 RepID=A0ABV8SBX2_9BACL
MTHVFKANQVVDCKGMACPMPIVRTKKALDAVKPGEVVEMQATDAGSLADIRSWAQNTGHHYLGTLHEGAVMKHFIRKVSVEETKEDIAFTPEIGNEEIQGLLEAGRKARILDVREPAEYAFCHIPGAIGVPLGELEARLGELDADETYYVICRTGRRSGMACRLLKANGYSASNVVPGMSEWRGPTEQSAR